MIHAHDLYDAPEMSCARQDAVPCRAYIQCMRSMPARSAECVVISGDEVNSSELVI